VYHPLGELCATRDPWSAEECTVSVEVCVNLCAKAKAKYFMTGRRPQPLDTLS